MKDRVLKIMHSQAGESIAETLIALLVASLALVMLAGAISSGAAAVQKGRDKLKNYYDNTEYIVNHAGGDGTDKVGNDTTEITITDNTGLVTIPKISVSYYYNKTFAKTPVITYKKSP